MARSEAEMVADHGSRSREPWEGRAERAADARPRAWAGRWTMESLVGAYRAFSELLRLPPSREVLDDAMASLRGLGRNVVEPIDTLRSSLANVTLEEAQRAWAESRRVLELPCLHPHDPQRAWAFVAADQGPDPMRAAELQVLAALGDRVVEAARLGRSELAAAVAERRKVFLVEHAASCLGDLGERLEQDGAFPYRSVGRGLLSVLGAELDADGHPPPRSISHPAGNGESPGAAPSDAVSVGVGVAKCR